MARAKLKGLVVGQPVMVHLVGVGWVRGRVRGAGRQATVLVEVPQQSQPRRMVFVPRRFVIGAEVN